MKSTAQLYFSVALTTILFLGVSAKLDVDAFLSSTRLDLVGIINGKLITASLADTVSLLNIVYLTYLLINKNIFIYVPSTKICVCLTENMQ